MTEGDKIFSKETVNDYEEYRRAVREGKEITPEELVTVAEMLGESPEWIKERAEKFHMPIGEYLIFEYDFDKSTPDYNRFEVQPGELVQISEEESIIRR